MNQSHNHLKAASDESARDTSKRRTVKLAITGAFLMACALSFLPNSILSQSSAATLATAATQDKQAREQERFDYLVRADFFAGAGGDQASLDRAMKLCEDTLAKNPKHGEAMVWHGSGLMVLSGQAYRKGDFQKGMELWNRGLKEMEEAARLEPDNVGVLIPRGATLLAASQFARPAEQATAMLEKGLNDYERVLSLQSSYFDRLSGHGRGELLFGLAEGWQRLGNKEKARGYFERVVKEAQGSGRQKQAAAFLETGTLPANSQSCTGCHTK
jgi:tetratricopeptide (TPR) repeat protein